MAYAQINYSQKLGTGPTVGTIAEYGCLLTSFCNLLDRFGENIDPPTLDNFFIQHGSFIVDPEGDRDLLSWGSVSVYDGQVIAVGSGINGWPDSNDAIVKFVYRNSKGGQVTHYCLVADHSAQTIVDSWDGVVKKSPYGQPVSWAKYERHAPQTVVITPPATPASAPAFTVETIAETTKELKVTTHLWDLNRRSWPDMANNPVGVGDQGATFKTTQIAHHILGGEYYLPEGSTTQGYNVVDTEDAPATAPAPTPAPVATSTPPAGAAPIPTAPESYDVVVDVPGYTTSNLAANHLNSSTTVHADSYSVFNKRSLEDGKLIAINVTKKPGVPGSWINPDDNHLPVPEPEPEPAPSGWVGPRDTIQESTVAELIAAPVSDDWKKSYSPYLKPVKYIATRTITVSDLAAEDGQPGQTLKATTEVTVYGVVSKDGVDYYRLRTGNDPTYSFWYCVPKIDPVTRTPYLLVKPQVKLEPVSTGTLVADAAHLARSKIAADAGEFLDDIMPKWLRKTKK